MPAHPFGHWKRYALACAAALLLFSATVHSARPSGVSVVADPTCPVSIQYARAERTAEGLVVTYSVRNDSKQNVRQLVLTAAAVTWLGEVIEVRMAPVEKRIDRGATVEYRATFGGFHDPDAERFIVGVQAVQWTSMQKEWRGTLTLSGALAIAAR